MQKNKNVKTNSIHYGGEFFGVSRHQSPKRSEALKIWLKSGKKKKPKEIAEELGVSPNQIRKWKSIDKWEDNPDSVPKRGAPYGNQNAVGNKGGPGGPIGNTKAVKHGLFRKWLPDDEEAKEIYDSIREGMSTLDILYEQILVAVTNFVRAQKIMYVKDKDDLTKEIKKTKVQNELVQNKQGDTESHPVYQETEYEIQFAWDKQSRVLTSQAAAMRSISNIIKQYEDLLRTLPPEEVKEEHRLRMTKIKADIEAAQSKAW